MATNLKNIIFDLGNVLIDWNPDYVYRRYFADDLEKMVAFYQETEIFKANSEMDRGSSFDEVLGKLSKKFPHHSTPIKLWKSQWTEMVRGPIKDSVKILESLYHKQYDLFALTNFANETFFTHIYNHDPYQFLNYFKDMVISGIEGVIKPELAIYEILIARNSLNPKHCIYIDDTEINLIPAHQLGMHVIKFSNPKDLENQLKSRGILE